MIHTLVNKNRLHVAQDAHYQGSVNSYNNGFTKAFSKLFGLSSRITINNESKFVNKKSYGKFLAALDLTPSKNEPMKNFDTLPCSFRKDQGLMREHISSKKANKLGKKFIQAILANDMQKATDLIGKGAQIDKNFWLRDRYGVSFEGITKDLGHQSASFQAANYTPFLYAVSRNNQELKDMLQSYRANEGLTGTKWHFQRQILSSFTHTSVDPVYYGHGTVGYNVNSVNYISGQDHYTKGEKISYNKSTNSLDFQQIPDHSNQWSKTNGGYSGAQPILSPFGAQPYYRGNYGFGNDNPF